MILGTLGADLRALPRTAWILFLGTFINRFGSFVMPFLAYYLTGRGFSITQAGIGVSAYGLGHVIASAAGGHLADAIGRRHTIALSMFASATTVLALSQVTSYGAILTLSVAAGAAAELYRPASAALIGDLIRPEQRIVAWAVYRFAVNLGFAAGLAVGGFLAEKSFLYLFIGDAATSVGFGVVAMFFLPHGLRGQTAGEKATEGIRVVLADRRFVLYLLATLAVTCIEFQTPSTLPLYIKQEGFGPRTYGLLMSINGLMIVFLELLLTNVTKRFKPQPIIALGYAMSAIGIALTGLAHSLPTLALTVVVWTLGEMIFAPVTGAYVTTLAPERYRGRYMGLWMMTWSAGMVFGPAFGTYLFERNQNLLWIMCAVAGLVSAGLALVTPKKETAPVT